MNAGLSTLCYIEQDGKWLMLHRTVKENDVNHDKWIGVGGHFEQDESPEECILREVREETGYTLTSWRPGHLHIRQRRHRVHAPLHGRCLHRHPDPL